MTILGIETATETCGVAIVSDGKTIGEFFLRQKNIHDTMLSELTRMLLDSCAMTVKSLDGIAVSSGPGSFTGLRIGMSFAKGLAFAGNTPLACVPTFDGIAASIASFGIFDRRALAVAFDARRDDVYIATYRIENAVAVPTHEAVAMHATDAVELIETNSLLAGDGTDLLLRALASDAKCADKKNSAQCIIGEASQCSAPSIALVGARMIESGQVADIATCEPYYAREFVVLHRPSS